MSATPVAPRPEAHEPPEVEATLVCAGCGTVAPLDRPFTPRCPARRAGDDIDHVLEDSPPVWIDEVHGVVEHERVQRGTSWLIKGEVGADPIHGVALRLCAHVIVSGS